MPPPPSISHAHWLLASVPVQKLDEAISSPKLSELKRDGPNLVLASDSLVVKVRTISGIFDRLRTRFGRGRLARQAAGATTLAPIGILTAQVLGHGTAQIFNNPCELLVMQRLPGVSLLALMQNPRTPIATEHAIADALGKQIAQMTMAGWFNRDHKPSNLIVQIGSAATSTISNTPDTPTIAIIDTVDILPIKPRHKFLAAAVRMLTSLLLEPTGCNCPPRRALRRRVLLALHRELWVLQGESNATANASTARPTSHVFGQKLSDPGATVPATSLLETPGLNTPNADTVDAEWESQSTRAVWNMTRDRIAAHLKKHGSATPKVSPI